MTKDFKINPDTDKVMFCPPFADYKEPPEDHPGGELEDCPYCEKQMWTSTKKRTVRALLKEHAILVCYRCFMSYAVNNKEECKEIMSKGFMQL